MRSLSHIKDQKNRNYGLDVVRCLAISMVWVMHSIQEIFHIAIPYLWYVSLGGVDLFFSLSGFLIGRILLGIFTNHDLRIKDIPNFWIRRWFRTLPLYFIIYFIYLAGYNLFLYPVNFNVLYLFFLHDLSHKPGFFSESWSLRIEEWFYLCVPVIVFVLYTILLFIPKNKRGEISYLSCAMALIISMIIFRQIQGWEKIENEAVIFRLDSIAYGLLAAYFSYGISFVNKSKSILLIICGLVIWMIAAILKIDPHINYSIRTLYYPLCGIGTSILVTGFFYYPFQRKLQIVTYTSTISYSIYLIHLSGVLIPLSIATKELNHIGLFIIWLLSFPLIFFISSYSYKYIESNFLKLRNRVSPIINTSNQIS